MSTYEAADRLRDVLSRVAFGPLSATTYTGLLDEALAVERSAGAAPLDVLDRIKARIPNPPLHEHEYGCGHNGEGIDPEYQRGWTFGRRYDNEQVRFVLDDLADEYARLAEGTDR